jgi:hypothetical protein
MDRQNRFSGSHGAQHGMMDPHAITRRLSESLGVGWLSEFDRFSGIARGDSTLKKPTSKSQVPLSQQRHSRPCSDIGAGWVHAEYHLAFGVGCRGWDTN